MTRGMFQLEKSQGCGFRVSLDYSYRVGENKNGKLWTEMP